MYDERHDREKRPDSICEVGSRDTRREEIGNSARSVAGGRCARNARTVRGYEHVDTYRMRSKEQVDENMDVYHRAVRELREARGNEENV